MHFQSSKFLNLRFGFPLLLAFLFLPQPCFPGIPDLMLGAKECVRKAPEYDPSYRRLEYPGGDPGWERGVCTDVIIRAFRSTGIDLQQLLHEDILSHPEAYRIKHPDRNIDHRRVPNLVVFFRRHAETLPLNSPWEEGDIVVWDLRGSSYPSHIGLISGEKTPEGRALVYHHFPRTGKFTGHPHEDDCLSDWPILYHFRWIWDGTGENEEKGQ